MSGSYIIKAKETNLYWGGDDWTSIKNNALRYYDWEIADERAKILGGVVVQWT